MRTAWVCASRRTFRRRAASAPVSFTSFSGAIRRAMATESRGLSYTSPAQAVTIVMGRSASRRAQGFGQLPAGAAGADDDHAGRVARGAGHRRCAAAGLGAQGVEIWCFIPFEIGLGHAAQRAGPVVGDVVKTGAGGQPAVGVALGFVVDVAAGVADVLLPWGQGLHGRRNWRLLRCHAGISSADRRAISLRRCLMAGVTMATNCASRTRRCTSEPIR